jgi:acetyltransferase-like isoleucine patch superfamily enzyme
MRLAGYVDPQPNPGLEAQDIARIEESNLMALHEQGLSLIMGFVGADAHSLVRRLALFRSYQDHGAAFPSLVHPRAIVEADVFIGRGAQILAGAIVNAGAVIGDAAVINTGAIIEHDAVIGAGAHIAPGAIVLGHARIGDAAFVGSGSVIVQQAQVAPQSFHKALSIHKP